MATPVNTKDILTQISKEYEYTDISKGSDIDLFDDSLIDNTSETKPVATYKINTYQKGKQHEDTVKDLRRYMVVINQYDKPNGDDDMAKSTKKILDGDASLSTVVIGYIKNEITYNLSAQWEQGSEVSTVMSNMLADANSVVRVIDPSIGNHAGYLTKKYYKGGTDLDLSVTFRIFDKNYNRLSGSDNNNNLYTSNMESTLQLLNRMVLPTMFNGGLGVEKVESIVKAAKDTVVSMKTAADKDEADSNNSSTKSANDTSSGGETTNNPNLPKAPNKEQVITQAVIDDVKNLIKSGIDSVKEQDPTIDYSRGPAPVFISIGSWLTINKAIVKDINFTFSKAQGKAGPLWVDVDLKISTLENLVLTPGKDKDKSKSFIKGLTLMPSSNI
jgi:hypothetical protein